MVGGHSMGPGLQLVGARFSNFLLGKPSRELNFALGPYFMKSKWPHFGTASRYSHMVGHADSVRYTVYVDMTLIRSKVKVKVTEHLNFRQLPITAHF